ncbi:OmpA family protein [Nonomuraea endophytica]|uniref:Outer membrane protein OmpA-like peptidoglycan-associated protein n=1 Tax=Nonomuraea endophytica TaxID=714136 RepID=A0A7W8EG22_9ACTN|nr:OmpA family protein [Nonomuraea endophytica]MBB5078023.1 outer membrane protein OmpA-like peptidoglycan-associated protein [Nonomuraea endophytica]
MSRSPERLAAVALAAALVLYGGPALAEPVPAPVEDLVAPVEDLLAEVESLDGSQSESKRGQTVTVALTSDVLFALDKHTLSAKARQRVAAVAAKIGSGPVSVEGHTDDQGADAYNLALSQRRAQAVQRVLEAALKGRGVAFQAKGFGETKPKLPNQVGGQAIEENRAKNRRVEIIFNVGE